MRPLFLIILSSCLAGCVAVKHPPGRAATAPATVFYAYNSTGHSCYIRFQSQIMVDQICVEGDRIRYSLTPEPVKIDLPMPQHVEALFSAISVKWALTRRAGMIRQNAVKATVH